MFCHLRLHSEFSIVDGINRVDDVVVAAAADGQGALALTDHSNLFGAIKFYKAARGAGVKPLLGADVWIEAKREPGAEAPKDAAKEVMPTERLLLLCADHQGYLNVCELLARAWRHNVQRAQAVLRWDWLEELSGGLICLSGAQGGPVGAALLRGDESQAAALALDLARIFPARFFIELQRAGRTDDEAHVRAAVGLASRLSLPVVATHPVQFTRADDFEAHEARVCIAEGELLGNPKRVRRFTREQCFKSQAEMEALFADIPSAIAHTQLIAQRCNLTIQLGKNYLPDFPTPLVDGRKLSIDEYLRHASFEGLEERLALLFPDPEKRQAQRVRYVERLEFEIATILKMGFPGYFLIVSDFIQWAKANGCPVGPGRGSGAGSLVAYVLKITDLDPLQYNLLFERFLNPERVSMPDFDIDFCQANRDRVIDYVKAKYGKDAVSQIATFGTMAARAVVRDVGRVLDFSYGFCDSISKLIPNKPGQHITLEGAKKEEPELARREREEEDVKELLALAQKLEGLTRNVGMHAGGVLIAPGKLTDFTPLYAQPGTDSTVSQYDKDDVEAAGLVKFDFLGLATLTILEIAKGWIQKRGGSLAAFEFERIPLDDARVYRDIFQTGKTEAVFQFESRGMQGMLRDAKPTRLEDLIAMNALYRPGPMDLIPSYIARKHGKEEVIYPDPRVEAMLSETYGIMVYQEQVMLTAQILGGYSLGGADLLRRAMGKKKPEEMAKQRLTFREGAAKNGIDEAKADQIFDDMEKFAGYGFNKSHAAAYALLAYHTAYVKQHFPAEFYCANMTVEMDNTDKLKVLVDDARQFGVSFEPPDVNRGCYEFEPVSNKVVRYGLGAVKGTGRGAIEAIMAAREGRGAGARGSDSGPFKSIFDFAARIDRTKINKRALEALVKAGAFDSIQPNRAALLSSIERAMDYADAQEANAMQGGLFDMDDSHAHSAAEPDLAQVLPWGVKERLTQEKTAVGFYLTGHLFDASEAEVRRFAGTRIDDLLDSREPQVLAGIVSDWRVINGNRGKLAIFKLDDKSGSIEATADEKLIAANADLLREDELVIVQGKVQNDRFSGGLRLNIQNVWGLAQARCRFGRYLRVAVNGQVPNIERIVREHPPQVIETDLGPMTRALGVRLRVQRNGAKAEIALGDAAKFFPSDEALASWTAQAHDAKAEVIYGA